jgi:uncharacterized protein YecE (DUF72 family)
MEKRPDIRVGPAGWSYEDWKGTVYPDPPPPGFDPLAFLARLFRCVEINVTFYRPVSPRTADSWLRRVPEDFLFTAKAWERFSHAREGFTDEDVRLFREGLAPLARAGRLGAVLLQFPWFFRHSAAARERLRRALDALDWGAPRVVELRHRSWLEAIDFLRHLGVGFCNIDQPDSPSAPAGTRLVTGPVGYVRLHGRNAQAWFDPAAGRDRKYDYLYSLEELRAWIEAIPAFPAERVFVIANNHFRGKAVVNALQLQEAFGMPADPPEPLRRTYPNLLRGKA